MTETRIYAWKRGRTAETRLYTDIYVEHLADGGMKLRRSDMGPDIEARYGKYDSTSWLIVAPKDMPMAMTTLLLHSFNKGKRLDWQSLATLFGAAGIPVQLECW